MVPVFWIGLSNFWHLGWALQLLTTQLFWWFSVLIYKETQAITMSHSCHERQYFERAFYRFNPATFLCLSKVRTWIPNIICHGLIYVQWFEVRSDCSFCWPSLFKVSLHIFLHHSSMDMCYFIKTELPSTISHWHFVGNITMSYNSSILSWYEAYQRCKDDGQDLLQNVNEKYVGKYKDERTYWVSFFRRTRISWSTGKFMI